MVVALAIDWPTAPLLPESGTSSATRWRVSSVGNTGCSDPGEGVGVTTGGRPPPGMILHAASVSASKPTDRRRFQLPNMLAAPARMVHKARRERRARPSSRTSHAGLYIVATPIGNLGDITRRAVDVLGRCDAVACEDTRVTGKLLKHLGISKPLWRYDDHAGERDRAKLVDRCASGPWRWSAMPERRWCPIPAIAWCAMRARRALRSPAFPGRARRSWR